MLTGYLAAAGFVTELRDELGQTVVAEHDRLLLGEGPPIAAAWVANIWFEPREIAIASIAEGARQLRALQRNWALYPSGHYRRAKLIEAKLPHLSAKALNFPDPPPIAPLGAWTLTAPDRIIAAPRTASPVPNGEWRFNADKYGPPNRAYLKLWEVLTRSGCRPGPGDFCIDLGASPGGWTWVLARLGATVLAVDKAPLDSRIAALPGVAWLGQSAFALDPKGFDKVDWLFSDIACYPDRLYRLIHTWLHGGRVRNFVCTVKFQGTTDHEAARAFAAIPGGSLLHLHHNKHELTWTRLAQD